MRRRQLFILSLLATAPLAGYATPLAPPWDDIRLKHTWNSVPRNWETHGDPPAGTTIDLHIALKSRLENAFIDTLSEVSDPRSPKYGAHLSKEQVAQLVAPHPDTLELVDSWLQHHGVPSSSISTTHGGSWLTLSGVPVSQANEMLGASYQLYRRTDMNDSTILRTIGYGLPAVLHAHVQTVAPTTYFTSTRIVSQTKRRRSAGVAAALRPANASSGEFVRSLTNADGDPEVTPPGLRWLYRSFAYAPAATDQNILGVAGFGDDYPSPADLTMFMSNFRTDAVDATFNVVQINGGGYGASDPTEEASLNVQYAQAMAYPIPNVFYSTGGDMLYYRNSNQPATGDAVLEWLRYVLSQRNVPQTISISYGVHENTLPLEYATTLCALFGLLGLRGSSVLFASGDHGVGEGDCVVNDGSQRARFIPLFPASCPWVTSVGGTTGYPEVAASLSGGGFSDYFMRPNYQNDAVLTFLQRFGDNYYNGLYNPTGRGIPDISAQALDYVIFRGKQDFLISGTSCAAPTAAGIISLLNDYLLSMGKPPLGFLNPWLYGEGLWGLNDIRLGSNPGCGTQGFPAIPGWDPATGLGTPDFLDLQDSLHFRDL